MHPRREQNPKTKSAALLAAEAAFAPPKQSAERLTAGALPAAVTVLRMNRAAAPVDLTDSSPRTASDFITSSDLQLSGPRATRVFLVKAANLELAPKSSESWPLGELQAGQAGAGFGNEGAASGHVLRARRSRNRPPPVTVVFSAKPATDAGAGEVHRREEPASPARMLGDSPAQSSTSLAAALAEIEPTFAAIGAAMEFTVEDPQAGAQWERLSKILDQIAVEISASYLEATAG